MLSYYAPLGQTGFVIMKIKIVSLTRMGAGGRQNELQARYFQVTTCYLEYELPPLEVLAGLRHLVVERPPVEMTVSK